MASIFFDQIFQIKSMPRMIGRFMLDDGSELQEKNEQVQES